MSHISRRRFLVTGLTAGSALALGTGAYLFLSRLPICVHPSLPGMREFGLGNNTSIRTVAWSPDGSAFAAGGSDAGHVVIWRTSDGQELTSLPIIRYAVAWSLAWSPQSRYFAVAWSGAGSTGSYVSIWKTPTQKSASSWKHERDFPISGRFDVSPLVVAWSPDGTRLGVGDSGGGLQVWNPSSGQVLRVLQTSQAKSSIPVSSLAWSPDGAYIAALKMAAGAKYAVWNATTGKAMLLPSQLGISIAPDQWYLNTTALGWSRDHSNPGANWLLDEERLAPSSVANSR